MRAHTPQRTIPVWPILVLAASACTMVEGAGHEFGAADAAPRIVTPDQVARSIDEREIRRHIAFLASDAMRGRDTPSPELERAASWIADRFRAAGLRPAGDHGGYIQFWPYDRIGLDTRAAALSWRSPGRSEALERGRDYAALPGMSPGGEAPLVFLGPAEDAPDSMMAAAQKIAVVLLPGDRPAAWRWPITVRRSALTAARAGALGVVFVLDPAFGPDEVAALAATFASPTDVQQPVPLFFVARAGARGLISAAGGDLDALARDAATGQRRPVPLDRAAVRAVAPQARIAVQVPNVAGELPGSDPARSGEYVVLVAHFDHVGVGPPDEAGDSIYNGADDNASGTAALIEIARAFARLGGAHARPVLFLAVSGEEKGLLGSTWFATNPTVFLSGAAAVLNMDMIGRNHPDSVGVIGHSFSTLGPLVDRVAAELDPGLRVAADPMPQEGLFARSDHFPFAQRGIPAIALTTLLHDDYHRPSDEAGRIDAGKATKVARLVFLTAYDLAEAEARPEWTEAGRAAVRGR